MTKNWLFGPVGAAVAALALLLGPHDSAQAQIRIDGAKSVAYAKETLLKTEVEAANDTDDETTYYEISRDHNITGRVGVSANPGHKYFVAYRLSNMVFAEQVPAANLALMAPMIPAREADDAATPPVTAADAEPASPVGGGDGLSASILDGGAAGDNMVVFEVTVPALGLAGTRQAEMYTSVTSAFDLRLTGVKLATAEGGGSITRTVTNDNLPAIVVTTDMRSLDGAVKVSEALTETIRLPSSWPLAVARHDFQSFAGSTSTTAVNYATVGTLMTDVVGEGSADSGLVAEGAVTPEAVTAADAAARAAALKNGRLHDARSDDLIESLSQITTADTTDTVNNPITFAGNFAFVDTVGLAAGSGAPGPAESAYPTECGGSIAEVRVASEADPDVLTNVAAPQGALSEGSEFTGAGQRLCLQVDGETVIPETVAYTVTTSYKGITGAAFPPVGAMHSLTGIYQDGTTVRIPFMVAQEERYRQRISIVNRNAEAVDYSFTFTGEEGAMVTAGAAAEGEVPANMALVLDTRDIVTIEGGVGRAAASLSVVATPGTIDVAVTLVNRSDGSTTVVHASN